MDFNSLSFLFFFFPLFVAYWSVPKKYQWVVLLLASIYFYFSWKPAYGAVIFLSTLVTYFAGIGIAKYKKHRAWILLVAALVDFGVLFLFKYLNFFNYSLNSAFSFLHFQMVLPQFKLLLPIGVSFYTFQTVGYLIDIYRGTIKPEKNVGIFTLFVLFFPKLVAGPIEKSKDFLPQLRKEHSFNYAQTVSGLKLFAFGLFKKLVIADNLALVVDRVFKTETLEEYKGLSLVLAILFYSWQIYADFSGYTDMARGVGRMLGYELMENFRAPYFATSVRDFWRRWHISLSTWLRDYLYIPLGGSRKGEVLTYINTMIVFIVCGIWHGAAWTFVFWGALHGVMIAIERVVDKINNGRVKLPQVVAMAYTYGVICVSWVFFRASSFEDALYILRNAGIGVKNFVLPSYIWATLSKLFITNKVEMVIAAFCLLTIVFVDFLSTKISLSKLINKQHVIVRYSLYVTVLTLILLLRNIEIKEFIYVQF